ncbi:MAG: hypothetical protein QT05_C0024G0003 [archaeon GW2011_AR13]|nr:MAG: hypothetical protein QT05_C0024G0003 [archaeon GW2011_AR13]HIG94695.1 matrixin family metalloprotease [Nanoarchaeota archaeon]HIH63491.1 matrixin family metalloprotease [Nanoarchaeota archaeon]HIJ09421.1 matrixin family metalloprotease [Nanoarchaeota archaeon]
MTLSKILGFLFIIFTATILIISYFSPFQEIQFRQKVNHNNFSLNSSILVPMQFYENMRFPSNKISYRINGCPLNKKNNMEDAFEIIQNQTILEFYPVKSNEELSITCEEKNRLSEGLFIAGEGGPTNITQTENFNVILNGQILLIRESTCHYPNIALHELLHALGFDHSQNQNNIMYNITNCDQTIGEDIITLINELYSYPQYTDLAIENVSAYMHGRYLDTTINVRNNGLKESENTTILIYANNKIVNEIPIGTLDIGYGLSISMNNTWISVINVKTLDFLINSNSEELQKNNNRIRLEIDEIN